MRKPIPTSSAMRGIACLKEQGVEFQINSTVTKGNLGKFKEIFTLAKDLGAAAWHIFLLVPKVGLEPTWFPARF